MKQWWISNHMSHHFIVHIKGIYCKDEIFGWKAYLCHCHERIYEQEYSVAMQVCGNVKKLALSRIWLGINIIFKVSGCSFPIPRSWFWTQVLRAFYFKNQEVKSLHWLYSWFNFPECTHISSIFAYKICSGPFLPCFIDHNKQMVSIRRYTETSQCKGFHISITSMIFSPYNQY